MTIQAVNPRAFFHRLCHLGADRRDAFFTVGFGEEIFAYSLLLVLRLRFESGGVDLLLLFGKRGRASTRTSAEH